MTTKQGHRDKCIWDTALALRGIEDWPWAGCIKEATQMYDAFFGPPDAEPALIALRDIVSALDDHTAESVEFRAAIEDARKLLT